MKHHKPENNFLIANRKLEKTRSNFLQMWSSRAESAVESRRQQERSKNHRLLAFAIKWDVIRSKRAELLEIQQEVKNKITRCSKFTHMAFFLLTIKKVREVILLRIKRKITQISLVFKVNLLKMKYKRQLQRCRPTQK